MSTGSGSALRMGFEYEALRKVRLRAGYSTRFNSFCFGTGYQAGNVTVDLGFATHEILGITSSISVIFKIR